MAKCKVEKTEERFTFQRNTIYIGIDLGLKGGIVATYKGEIIFKEVMPLIASTDVDIERLYNILFELKSQAKLTEAEIHVVFEKFAGFFGYMKSAAVSLARQSGMVEAVVSLFGAPYTKVIPQSWQKVMWKDSKIINKGDGRKDTKKISLLTAKRLFPKESFLATERSSKPHDGLIDAAMLSLYGYRERL